MCGVRHAWKGCTAVGHGGSQQRAILVINSYVGRYKYSYPESRVKKDADGDLTGVMGELELLQVSLRLI